MKKIFKQLKRERLTLSEKSEMKTKLNLFVRENPIIQPTAETADRMDFFRLFQTRRRLAFAGAMIAVALTIMSGTAYAAEESLPGDILYPIKINVNEKIRTAITLNSESRVAWEVKKTERRLEEMEKIAARGNFDQKEQEKLEVNLSAQANLTRRRIESLEKTENEGKIERFSADLEKSLKKSRRLIEEIENQTIRIEVKTETENTRPKERPRPERTMIKLLEEEEKMTNEIKIKAKERFKKEMDGKESQQNENSTSTEKKRDPEIDTQTTDAVLLEINDKQKNRFERTVEFETPENIKIEL
ncbi:MAG: DUF5667 domain-containing protein [Patescibacteria group bacterium]